MEMNERIFMDAPVSGELFNDLSDAEIASSKAIAEISLKLYNERQERNMNQKDFAKFMGVSQGMVSKWENLDPNFTIETLFKIFNKLEYNVEIKISKQLDSFQAEHWNSSNLIIPAKDIGGIFNAA